MQTVLAAQNISNRSDLYNFRICRFSIFRKEISILDYQFLKLIMLIPDLCLQDSKKN